MVRLWHDDIRLPPPGWMWARTNEEAKLILRSGEVEECSLDHDLGLELHDPTLPDADMQAGWDAENDGLKLVDWMIENNCVPSKVNIHSWNPVGAENMWNAFMRAGYRVNRVRYVHEYGA